MMKFQYVILKAMAKKITWMAAAEIGDVSDRTMRRIKHRYEEFGYETYFDFSVVHFHEKLWKEHGIKVSYSSVKRALQGAGLGQRRRKRGSHRRRRPRRPLPGMLLHIDGSKHRWFQDDRYYDLIVILDDATSEIYYARLVEANRLPSNVFPAFVDGLAASEVRNRPTFRAFPVSPFHPRPS